MRNSNSSKERKCEVGIATEAHLNFSPHNNDFRKNAQHLLSPFSPHWQEPRCVQLFVLSTTAKHVSFPIGGHTVQGLKGTIPVRHFTGTVRSIAIRYLFISYHVVPTVSLLSNFDMFIVSVIAGVLFCDHVTDLIMRGARGAKSNGFCLNFVLSRTRRCKK